MNILILNFEFPPLGGGGGVATKQLADELAKKHTVSIITTGYKNLLPYERVNGVHIYRVPVLGRTSLPTASLVSMITFLPMAFFKGIALTKRTRFDVINAQFVLPSGLPAALLSWLFNIPLVVSLIGGDIYDPTKGISPHRHILLRLLIRVIVKQATACTAISEDTKKRAQSLHGITKEIIVTPLGLVPKDIPSTDKQTLGLPLSSFLAVSVGRLIPRKSYHVLLEAFKQVPTNASLLIIGDGPLKESLTKWILTHSLQERVHLLGFVEETKKMQILKACDLYVSAAEHEGFGIVFLEAMEAGLPIVAVNEGGQTDFLQNEENALLVAPHDSQSIAQAINTLISQPSLRASMKDHNQKKVKHYYLPDTARRFEQVLERATTPL